MPVTNADIAAELDRIADLLDIEGANPFRVRAYRRAARIVEGLPRSVADMLAAGEDLDALPGIGKDLAGKIAAIAAGQHPPLLAELEREVPPGITALLAIPGLGPKRVRTLYETLGITDVAALAAAARAGRLRSIPGFGPVIEAKILEALSRGEGQPRRLKLRAAEQIVEPLLRHLRQGRGILAAEVAGSYRRRRETVGDLDLVVASETPEAAIAHFLGYDEIAQVAERGPTRARVVLRNGTQVDLRAVEPASYGAALLYFTGSQAHDIALRRIAVEKGLKLNEYGLFRGRRRIAGRTEEEIYAALGLAPIPPELREDLGEIAAAREGRLPRLVTAADIRGDLHAHTDATDGRASLKDMAQAARDRGYAYLAITDHSRRLTMAHGLGPKELARQVAAIRRLNATLGGGFTLLASIEVDILEDGRLDLPDAVLADLDLVVGAIHSHFGLSREKQTERLLRAMDNRHLDIIAHPTGRMINARPPYPLDMERLLRAARERGCHFEVNAQPDRLDLSDSLCRLAKEIGVKVAISTDAHGPEELAFMRYGVDQARRGWLEPDDVLNTRPLPELMALLRRGA
ncbi:DNA polymerase/3'-5' exonuclease PolX [Caldovatus aquaticus]|uniref:DNA-directed DNA polymerase n=1 Tax=Caldovatus aquaticus TaxID=2865671 RepID=A0ABS7F0X5_9PROT|nr:DNA polymerase/3'-5' exonuclease PolX [Caldovatus aquaticus]MBW8269277.1 DNA polymerase/3'-5' exonuclease PolX [Caldovatus aquaticus]